MVRSRSGSGIEGRMAMALLWSVALAVGTAVEVRTRYLETWVGGFEVVSVQVHGVRVRRRSDGVVLPAMIAIEDVRRTKPPLDAPAPRLAVA
jgi:hypothetical protein